MVRKIATSQHAVEIGSLEESSFYTCLQRFSEQKKVVVMDENTYENCWSYLLQNNSALATAELIVLPAGEENKSLEICNQVWEALTTYEVKRNDVLINLGGGVITDMGGFIASLYKRGIRFIHLPTTLLAMVDASVGGKTAVNFAGFKNQIGVFSAPELVVCDTTFLQTLDDTQLLSGTAEMLKHGLIADAELAKRIFTTDLGIPTDALLEQAIAVKASIVALDFKENGERKKLNFGHTIGHALEEWLLQNGTPRTHGECVAWGMLAESFLSLKYSTLSQVEFEQIAAFIHAHYAAVSISESDFPALLALMKNDKKNEGNAINFTFLSKIGGATINNELNDDQITEGLKEMNNK